MAADPAAATAGATTLEAARAHSEKDESRREMSAMNTALADDAAAVSPPVVEGPESMVEAAAVTPPAVQTQTTAAMAAAAPSASSSDRSRLFIVCGRGRKADELHQLFSACGEIRNLHFALDRSSKSRVSIWGGTSFVSGDCLVERCTYDIWWWCSFVCVCVIWLCDGRCRALRFSSTRTRRAQPQRSRSSTS